MYLIIGSGWSGCVLAHLLAIKYNKKVILLEKNKYIGGKQADYYSNNVIVPRFFFEIIKTNKISVIEFLENMGKWIYLDKENKGYLFAGVPVKGYSVFMENLVSHPNIKILLETDYFQFRNQTNEIFEKIIYTGKLDDYFSQMPKLDYISTVVSHITINLNGYFQNGLKTSLNPLEDQYEWKHIYNDSINKGKTIISRIRNSHLNNEPYICNASPSLKSTLKEYEELVNKERNVIFIGRLAQYRTWKIDELIQNVFDNIQYILKDPIQDNSKEYVEMVEYALLNYNKQLLKKVNKEIFELEKRKNKIENYIDKEVWKFKLKMGKSVNLNLTNEIVICRYNEDVNWIYNLLDQFNWIQKIKIFNKGETLNIIHPKVFIENVKNIGREGETYLSFIINNYNHLPENIWFLQANPFDHSPDFTYLLTIEAIKNYNYDFQPLSYYYNKTVYNPINDKSSYILGNKVIQYCVDKNTQQIEGVHKHFDREHQKKVERLGNDYIDNLCNKINIEKPKQIIPFTWGALFYVNKEKLIQYSVEVFKKLREELLNKNDQGGDEGYALERFWQYLLTNNSFSSVEEFNKYYNL